MHGYLYNFLIFLLAAVIVVPIFRYFKLGAILAYLFAGVLLGPQILGIIKNPEHILRFSELGVVFLLFLIGLELQPSRLWNMRLEVFGLGSLQVLISGGVLYFVGISFGLSWQAAFIAGFGLALSSTAFSLQLLEEHHQLPTLHGKGSFSILLFQDLAVVPLIAAVPLLSGKISVSPTWVDAFKIMGSIIGLILVGRFIIRHFFRFIAESRVQEVFTASTLLIVTGTALLFDSVGLSMGMGAFIAGVLLANSEYRHELESNLLPFKGLLLGLFFMAVGMSLDLVIILKKPHWVMGLVVLFMSLKGIIIFLLARVFRFPYETSRNMAFTLPQGGEFAFVLFASALGAELFDQQTSVVLNAAVTISMALTPLLFELNQKYLRSYSEITERPMDKIKSDGAQVIIAGYGRFGQIVSRFLSGEKISFTILEHSAAQVDTARKFGSKIYYGDATRKDIVEAAGGNDAKIFVLAIDDPEASIETAKMVRKYFPHLKIIARVRNRLHAIELLAMGIDDVHRETYLTSLEVAKDVLLKMGRERPTINRRLALFRLHDEKVLRQEFDYRDDQKGLITLSSKANKELEDILRADLND